MRLNNTLTNRVEDLVPVEEGRVRIYGCGPTVYRYVHVGNLRTFLLSDVLRRALRLEGYDVTLVMNITDVGHMTDEVSDAGRDRMELSVEDEGLSPAEIARKYTQAYLEDTGAIGIEPADVMPKATDHIPEMLELTAGLLERGHAYEVNGTVYFDVHSFPGYGKLSGNTLDKLRTGHREIEVDPNKRHPEDFALWKRAGANRLMRWDSSWGPGFPGWHIECSAMSMKYLGERFDIHTGGNDLKFPHHEDEIAQSEGVVGHQVVSIWVHTGFLNMSGVKMSKSRKNVVRIGDLVEELGIDPLAFRYLCFQTRYRSEMDLSLEALKAANHTLRRLRARMADWAGATRDGLGAAARDLDGRFRAAVADDLDLPAAVTIVSEAVSADVTDGDRYALLASWDGVLGLDLEREAREGVEVPEEVRALVRERDDARARKDFARSDALREEIRARGFEVRDGTGGTEVRPGT